MLNIIKARKVSYDYLKIDDEGNVESSSRAVDGVDLDVKAGDFVAVLGHNGSGKSTLAKHINAILLPTEGTLYVDRRISVKLLGWILAIVFVYGVLRNIPVFPFTLLAPGGFTQIL